MFFREDIFVAFCIYRKKMPWGVFYRRFKNLYVSVWSLDTMYLLVNLWLLWLSHRYFDVSEGLHGSSFIYYLLISQTFVTDQSTVMYMVTSIRIIVKKAYIWVLCFICLLKVTINDNIINDIRLFQCILEIINFTNWQKIINIKFCLTWLYRR